MPEETSKGYERLTFVDDNGRRYLGAEFEGCPREPFFYFCFDLLNHLNGTAPDNVYPIIAGLTQLDRGRDSPHIYFVYDPLETLITPPHVEKRSWD